MSERSLTGLGPPVMVTDQRFVVKIPPFLPGKGARMMAARIAVQPGFKGWPECEVCGRVLTDADGVIEVERGRALQITWARETRHLAMATAADASAGLGEVPLGEEAHWRWAHRSG